MSAYFDERQLNPTFEDSRLKSWRSRKHVSKDRSRVILSLFHIFPGSPAHSSYPIEYYLLIRGEYQISSHEYSCCHIFPQSVFARWVSKFCHFWSTLVLLVTFRPPGVQIVTLWLHEGLQCLHSCVRLATGGTRILERGTNDHTTIPFTQLRWEAGQKGGALPNGDTILPL